MRHRNFIPLSIVMVVLFWILDSLLHWVDYGDLRSAVLAPSPHELSTRVLISALIVCFGILATYYTNQLIRKGDETRRAYKATANESQRILKQFLHEVHYFEGEAEMAGGFDQKTMKYLGDALRKTEQRIDGLLELGEVTAQHPRLIADPDVDRHGNIQGRVGNRRRRRLIAFVSIAVCVCLAGIIFVGVNDALNEIRQEVIDAGRIHNDALYAVQDLSFQMAKPVRASLSYLLSGDPQDKAKFLNWRERRPMDNERYWRLAGLDGTDRAAARKLFSEISTQQVGLIGAALALFSEHEKNGKVQVAALRAYESKIDKLTGLCDQLTSAERIDMELHDQQALGLIGNVYAKAIIVGLLLLISGVTIVTYLSFFVFEQRAMEEQIRDLREYIERTKTTRNR